MGQEETRPSEGGDNEDSQERYEYQVKVQPTSHGLSFCNGRPMLPRVENGLYSDGVGFVGRHLLRSLPNVSDTDRNPEKLDEAITSSRLCTVI